MQNAKRMLCLLLCGIAALGLLTPLAAGAEEVRTYTVHFYTPDVDGNRHIVKTAEDVTVEGDSLSVEALEALLGEDYLLAREEPAPLPAAGKEVYVEVKKALIPYTLHFFYTDDRDQRQEVSTARLLLAADAREVSLEDQKKALKEGWTLLREEAFPIPQGETELHIPLKAPAPQQRELTVRYVTADGQEIAREMLTVPSDKTKLVATDLKTIPEGYRLVNHVDAALTAATVSVDILVEKDVENPTEKVISVHYTTKEGKKILTTNMTVAFGAKSVDTKALKDVPYGYKLVSVGSLTIDKDNAIHPVVEAEKKDADKDEVPKTGDSAGILLLTLLSASSLAAAAGLRKLR